MNPASLSAIAALAGSAVGGLTSFLATWLGQGQQIRAQLMLNDKARRQEIYRDFVNEGSTLYVDALTSEAPDLGKLVQLYALISRMRIISSFAVSEEAKCVARVIFNAYTQPNKNFADIGTMVNQDVFDPMKHFSELCRAETEGMR
jgi:hypothetical protein